MLKVRWAGCQAGKLRECNPNPDLNSDEAAMAEQLQNRKNGAQKRLSYGTKNFKTPACNILDPALLIGKD